MVRGGAGLNCGSGEGGGTGARLWAGPTGGMRGGASAAAGQGMVGCSCMHACLAMALRHARHLFSALRRTLAATFFTTRARVWAI